MKRKNNLTVKPPMLPSFSIWSSPKNWLMTIVNIAHLQVTFNVLYYQHSQERFLKKPPAALHIGGTKW